jgi:hypothetical protein
LDSAVKVGGRIWGVDTFGGCSLEDTGSRLGESNMCR